MQKFIIEIIQNSVTGYQLYLKFISSMIVLCCIETSMIAKAWLYCFYAKNKSYADR